MANTIIFVGCRSSHNGVIITGDPLSTVCGVPIARVGDLHACPQTYSSGSPHGVTPIIKAAAGQRGTVQGREFALSGDRTGCGASILPCTGCAEATNA